MGVLDGDLNLKAFGSKEEEEDVAVFVDVGKLLPFSMLGFFPLFKGRQSGLTL